MNKPFYIVCFLLVLNLFQQPSANAQTNLIYNGDFELYDTCPTMVSGPLDMQIETCYGWRSATALGTSDYYNTCSPFPFYVGVPINWGGYQFAHSGNGYCGFAAYHLGEDVPDGHYKEYIQGTLIHPLISNKIYQFTAYVSLANASAIAVDQLGAYFSPTPISRNDYKPLNVIPQAILSNGIYLKDTLNWIKLSAEFVATGGEQFITIGDFKDTLSTDTLRVLPFDSSAPNFTSYYYIDSVNLIEKSEPDISNVFTPNGDGVNDFFDVSFLNVGLTSSSFKIFDRWGVKVFETNSLGSKWDGYTSSGLKCTDGVYYYIISGEVIGKTVEYKGFIQLVR